MGIRFACPNGHRLNVKTELAGKRAICPNCGARVVVPAAEAAPNPSQAAATQQPAAAPAPDDPPSAAAPEVTTAPTPPSVATAPTPEPQPAVWYVRPPAGGQFGPAAEDLFRDWIVAGRVVADAYVWCEGWTDWRLARDAADDLPAPLPAAPAETAAASTAPPPPPDATSDSSVAPESPTDKSSPVEQVSPVARYAARRRRAKQATLRWVLMMLFAALILGMILVWVVGRSSGEPAAMVERRPTEVARIFQPLYVAYSSAVVATRAGAMPPSVEEKT